VSASPRHNRRVADALKDAWLVALWLTLLIVLVLAMSACTRTYIPQATQGIGNGASAAEARRQAIVNEARLGIVKAEGDPLRSLKTIEVEAEAQGNDLQQVQAGNALASQALAEANDALARIEQKLKDEETHWVGYRTRTLLPWILGIAAGLWVTAQLFAAYAAPMSGVVGWLGKSLIGLLPAMNLPALWARFRGNTPT
jgi:hypothetical protein